MVFAVDWKLADFAADLKAVSAVVDSNLGSAAHVDEANYAKTVQN
jgi:hypothetical protein